MKKIPILFVLFSFLFGAAAPMRADEGMWTFDNRRSGSGRSVTISSRRANGSNESGSRPSV
jgi:hypothetical protein